MLSKKHFMLAAEAVRGLVESGKVTEAKILCETFVDTFSGDNPRFDVSRFRAACKPIVKAPKRSKRVA